MIGKEHQTNKMYSSKNIFIFLLGIRFLKLEAKGNLKTIKQIRYANFD